MQTVILDSNSFINIGAIDTSLLVSESDLNIFFESSECSTVSYKATFEVCKSFVSISFIAKCDHFQKTGNFYLKIKRPSDGQEIASIRVNLIK